jgi:fatty acid desaturase
VLDTQQSNPVKLLFRDREDFRAVHANEGQSFVAVTLLYAAILTSLAAGWLANNHLSLIAAAPIYLACFAVIGWAQYSIGNGMHEAVHHNFGNKKSDRWASVVTAYPIGLTMSYRSVHLEHHQHLGTSNDPELSLYTVFPKSRTAMLLRFAWFVSGIPAILQFFQQQSSGAESRRGSGALVTFATVQLGIVLAFYLAFGNVLFYIFLWALPIATVGKLLSSTRLLCEHGSPSQEWVVRTISGPRWQTWTMGAFDFNFHAEHHLFPSVPYAGLAELHIRHKAYAQSHPEYRPFDGRLEFFEGGYLRLLGVWFHELPWTA